MNYYNDLATLDVELIAANLGDPITSSLPLALDTRGVLAAAVSGHLNQAETLINVSVLGPALGIEKIQIHGTEWYVSPELQAEANLAAGNATIALSSLAQGDSISFSSPFYSLTETATSITVTPGAAAADNIVVPAGITSINVDHSFVLGSSTLPTVTLDLSGASDVTVTGWQAGDHLSLVTTAEGYSAAMEIQTSGRLGPLATSTSHVAVVVELGDVATDTAASVASLANASYISSASGSDAHGLFFEAQTNTGTSIYAFHGDPNGGVAASDLTHVATLVGVQMISSSALSIG